MQDASFDPMGMLLFEYLVHEGYWDTAAKVAQDILLGRVQVSQQVQHHTKLGVAVNFHRLD